MSGRLVALADVHGHHTELMALYQQLLDSGFKPEVDTLIGLGDENDGGPNTKQVIDQLIAWEKQYPHWVFLKGNHGDMMLDALVGNSAKYGSFDQWWTQGGMETARSYYPEGGDILEVAHPLELIPKEHLEWLATRPLTHETDGYYFVHAGFRPVVPIAQQSEEDMLWIRKEFYEQRYNFGKPVVYGHTPVAEPLVQYDYRPGHKHEIVSIGIDTMVGDYGKLTAVELTDSEPRFFFSPSLLGTFAEFKGF